MSHNHSAFNLWHLLLFFLLLGAGCTGTYERSGSGAQEWPLDEEIGENPPEAPDPGERACQFPNVIVLLSGKGDDSCTCFYRPAHEANHYFDCELLREDLRRGHRYSVSLECHHGMDEELRGAVEHSYREDKRLVQMSVHGEVVDEFYCHIFGESP